MSRKVPVDNDFTEFIDATYGFGLIVLILGSMTVIGAVIAAIVWLIKLLGI